MLDSKTIQIAVFLSLTVLVALITYIKCHQSRKKGPEDREYFLAGGSLSYGSTSQVPWL